MDEPASGQPPTEPIQPSPDQKTNILAILSLVFSILPFGIVGIILGFIGLSQIKKTHEQGKPLAIIGIVLGFLQVVVLIIILVLAIVAMNQVAYQMQEVMSNSCTISGGFSCNDFSVTGTSVELTIQNNVVTNVQDVRVGLEGPSCQDMQTVGSMATGATTTVVFDCPGGVDPYNTINVWFTQEGSPIPMQAVGALIFTDGNIISKGPLPLP